MIIGKVHQFSGQCLNPLDTSSNRLLIKRIKKIVNQQHDMPTNGTGFSGKKYTTVKLVIHPGIYNSTT